MSCFGDLAVDYISPQGVTTRIGNANGVAVYTPNPVRKFRFNLKNNPGIDFKTGKIHVTYSAPSDVKPETFAEGELKLN
jgi:hypothetical protein